MTRIFQKSDLAVGAVVTLDFEASHHLVTVLRAKLHDTVTLFNGRGGEYFAEIVRIDKKNVAVDIKNFIAREAESSLDIWLAQGISRGEKMDLTIQKAVELGVKKIIPLFTEFCNVKLDTERREKRLQHWRKIIISACEQCGRNRIPELAAPIVLNQWLKEVEADHCFVLAPDATSHLSDVKIHHDARVILLVGSEGGLSHSEIQLATQKHFLPLNLGPRILRTETAALAAITALQCYSGDL